MVWQNIYFLPFEIQLLVISLVKDVVYLSCLHIAFPNLASTLYLAESLYNGTALTMDAACMTTYCCILQIPRDRCQKLRYKTFKKLTTRMVSHPELTDMFIRLVYLFYRRHTLFRQLTLGNCCSTVVSLYPNSASYTRCTHGLILEYFDNWPENSVPELKFFSADNRLQVTQRQTRP